jgi:hypothetical protein
MSGVHPLAGVLLPEAIMHSQWFAVLTTFVAVNTVLYLTLAIIKVFPKLYLSDWVVYRGRRSETRSIYPAPEGALRVRARPVRRRSDGWPAPSEPGSNRPTAA